MGEKSPVAVAPEPPTRSLVARCQENAAEAYRVFARTTPGGIIEELDGLVLTDCVASDSMGNVAVATRPVPDGKRLIAQVEAFFAPRSRPWSLLAFADAAPGLEGPARDRRLRDEGRFPAMVLDPIPESIPRPADGIEVHGVRTAQELQLFEQTASRAYEVESGPVYDGWLHYPGFSFHLAYYRGEPVATATLVASHGIAGIVYVGTVPEARGRGFGPAAVWSAIEAGRELGLRTSALWASPMGRRMYGRMGFRPVTEFRIWTPPEHPLPSAFHSRSPA